ncbi:hypothetical protein BARBAKC583_0437 [Bartonella bacilliformis KC583]|uniref:Uncharacterized protein n=1 Tax=Bartonella bacilliformis (strain ATCC 35685 / KC583 / Herrer 020/F12,63) TaxID=360095 RepID=A1US02_BARBK|nr:hypothetical protein BARBAKC583_0437 [Bartonella bacilliformis KC583]
MKYFFKKIHKRLKNVSLFCIHLMKVVINDCKILKKKVKKKI